MLKPTIVSLARNLSVLLHRLWIKEEVFKPFNVSEEALDVSLSSS